MLDTHLTACKTKKKKELTSVQTCDVCNNQYLSLKSLKRHVYTIHGEFNCLECGEVFSSKNKLNHHKAKIHSLLDSAFPCSQCGKSFSYNTGLIRHVKTIHQRKQDLICSLCGKRFNQSSSLTKHISTVHYKVKRFKCTICGQRFGQSCHQTRHMKTIHDRIQYPCSQCEFSSIWKCNLTKHIKTVHLKEYRFNCKYCGQGCICRKYLESHLKRKHPKHWDLEQEDYARYHPEECSICKKKFKTRIELQRHSNNIHNHSIGLALNKLI